MKIKEIMSSPAVTCHPEDSLNRAAQMMWENDCGVLPVVRDDRLVGMITDRDICMAAYCQGDQPLSALQVSSAMSKQVFACQQEDSVGAAERLMRDKQIRRMAVVDGENRPIGVLSLNDIARRAESPKRDISEGEVVQTLAAISQPRKRSQQQGQHEQAQMQH